MKQDNDMTDHFDVVFSAEFTAFKLELSNAV